MTTLTPQRKPRRRRGCFPLFLVLAVLALLAGGAAIVGALSGLTADPLPNYRDLLTHTTGLATETGGATDATVAPEDTEDTATQTSQPRSPQVGRTPLTPDDFSQRVFVASNVARRDRGLPELAYSQCAADQARSRAAALVGTGNLVHAPLAPVINACDPPGLTAAENLLRGEVSPEEGVELWLESPGHAANLLSPDLSMLGVGCVRDATGDAPGWVCAQIFLG